MSIFPEQGKCKVPEGLAPPNPWHFQPCPLSLPLNQHSKEQPDPVRHKLTRAAVFLAHPAPQNEKGRLTGSPSREIRYRNFYGLAGAAAAGFAAGFAAGAVPPLIGYAWSYSLMISCVTSMLFAA